jgi:hypothetical protein
MSTRESIDRGSAANDGTGDTFRSGGGKIENNFLRLWLWAGGDSNSLTSMIYFDSDALVFEGTLADNFETRVVAANPTADRVITLPNLGGTLVLDVATQTLTNKTLTSPVLTTPQINNVAGTFQYVFVPGALAADRNITLPTLSTDDTFVFAAATQTLTNKTLTTPSISSPGVSGALKDANGADMVAFSATGSAVLNFQMINAATSGSPTFAAVGADSDIDMIIKSKNRGAVQISKGAYQKATVSASGAIPANKTYINFSSGSGISLSMANGTIDGEFKKMTNSGAGTATVTPANFAGGTSFAIAQNEGTEVIWNGANWFVISNQSVLTIA